MSRPLHKTLLWAMAAVVVVSAVGGGAWWLGMNQGMAMMAAPEAVGQAPQDPSQWSIPQGEEATRRHIRDGIQAGDTDPATGRTVLNYHDPMVPGKNFDAPAKSPFMDMMLVPRYAGEAGADTGTLSVSPRIQQNLGLRTALVTEGVLTTEVSATGAVVWNERDQVLLQARATGFVEKLHVRAVLDRVAKGAPVAELYVPSWIAAQEEYLAVARMQGADLEPLRQAARQRMLLAGMSEAQVQSVVSRGQLQPRFTVYAPMAGTVTELMLREGATVMAGATLLRVQGTDTVWAEGEVPESQAALLKVGIRVQATSPAAPGETFEGEVQALLPEVNTVTRTLKARMVLRNAQGRLVPGMLVQMRFVRPASQPVLLVPSDAVIRTGRRSVVMVLEDAGRFRPVEVRAGQEAGGQIEIVAGLQTGQTVVLSGNFLIDSEASLRGMEARLNGGEASGQMPAAIPSKPETALAAAPAQRAASVAAPVPSPAAAPLPAAPRYTTDAVVNAVAGDTVSLTHPPIPALKWPQMQMDFGLPPPEQLPRGLGAGSQVRIEFRMRDGDVPQITRIDVVAPGSAQ
ncbi:efflux RND transporter periplasmic adaptor subunit [Hydrogenophaga sp. PAMC20947]|uniref:efflux RND transporter periplasmic adaptor subunit n=1 Tax=Hydrogenophaga sp. PAMC20947 TaxID=2565558 RepID=UPI00109E050B|nr:efflux RND transporter periplasmic adaptor subunit [Hydrogenophaga sp. PAMC20947]QCB46578.1 efflux RND transporter periplasmic adaptor subunit [Hydrogenophaga sp. PAMC20947]